MEDLEKRVEVDGTGSRHAVTGNDDTESDVSSGSRRGMRGRDQESEGEEERGEGEGSPPPEHPSSSSSSVCTAELCGTVCSKSFLISINLTFMVLGCLLTGCGAWMNIFPESFVYSPLVLDNPTAPFVVLDRVAVAFIVVGVILFAVGFLGSCGTCTESVCFLGFYSTLVILSIGTQVIVIILASSFRVQMQSNLERSFYFQIRYEYNSSAQYTNDTTSPVYRITFAWDSLQSKLGCCGARGPRDYSFSAWHNHTGDDRFLPSSCCRMPPGDDALPPGKDYLCQIEAIRFFDIDDKNRDDDDDDDDDYDDDDYNNEVVRIKEEPLQRVSTKGCGVAVFELVTNYLPVITVIILLDVLQLVNLFYACCLMKDIRLKLSEYSWCEEDEDMS